MTLFMEKYHSFHLEFHYQLFIMIFKLLYAYKSPGELLKTWVPHQEILTQ